MINIDLWGGEYSQSLIASHQVKGWKEAHELIEEAAEGGFLINVIMSDFVAGLSDEEINDRITDDSSS